MTRHFQKTLVFFPRPIRLRINRATIYFSSYFLHQTFCLTKAYNFCHQVALVDGPMRRELGGVAKVLFNEKTTSARLHEASQLGLMKPHCATSWNTFVASIATCDWAIYPCTRKHRQKSEILIEFFRYWYWRKTLALEVLIWMPHTPL